MERVTTQAEQGKPDQGDTGANRPWCSREFQFPDLLDYDDVVDVSLDETAGDYVFDIRDRTAPEDPFST
jgi:hypothetical protein